MKYLLALLLLVACQPAWPTPLADRYTEVDALIARGDRESARRLLETIVDAPRSLQQDTHFRLARLALDDHQPAAALAHADRGLALGGEDDLFVANLLVARGAAHQALGQSAAAVDDYERASRINEKLLQELLP